MNLYGNALLESDTSRLAINSIERCKARILEHVYAFIEASPSTCDEVERFTGLKHQTASARVTELRNSGRIYDGGQRRKTRSGRQAVVWIATP